VRGLLLSNTAPKGLDDLKGMQRQTERVAAAIIRSTVAVRIGGRGGSGVIVSPDGYVLTCAHVTRTAGVSVGLILHDGRRVRARSLGANGAMDAGVIKITEKTPAGGWPFSEMGRSATLRPGQWCLGTGHAGGVLKGRTAPVRMGRVLALAPQIIMTDCTIVSGDSGGPLFDMSGRVIGISSRISGPLTGNVHVPIDAFRNDWARLASGDVWGPIRGRAQPPGPAPKPKPRPKPKPKPKPPAPFGIRLAGEGGPAKVAAVDSGSRAAEAGLKAGDVILSLNGRRMPGKELLEQAAAMAKAGKRVRLAVRREGIRRRIRIVLNRPRRR